MRWAGASVLVLLIAGCLAPGEPLRTADAGASVRLLEGGVEVDVPVRVMLVGFDPGVAQALAARLEPERVEHAWADDWRSFPPTAREPHVPSFKDAYHAHPLVAVARWDVREAPADLVAEFRAFVATSAHAEGPYDANAAEAWLAARLPQAGFALDPRAPSLVLLHMGETGHAWRYTLPNGWLEPARAFGEREALLAFDVSARADPYVVEREPAGELFYGALVGGRILPPQVYDRPLQAGGEATLAALAQLARDAVHFRLLHGSALPPALEPCHGVTLVLLTRATTLAEVLPGRHGLDWMDPAALEGAWRNLTGAPLFVDVRHLQLPQDDPVLDALSRPGQGAVGGVVGAYDALRWHLHERWSDYWVAHDGCAAYVSFVLLGDPGDGAPFGYSGIAMFDANDDRRISFSVVPDVTRLLYDPTFDPIAPPPPGAGSFDAVNYLFAHETAHLISEHHPHNVQDPEEGRIELRSFSSVWSSLSYQAGDRVLDLGTVDAANHARVKAGHAVAAARAAGLEGDPAFAAALEALARQDWAGATARLQPLVLPSA